MYITLQADIQAERQICQTQHYAKDLTLVRLRLRYPEQASYGALDDMPANLSRRMFEALANAPQGVAVRQWLDENLRIDPLHLQQGIAAPSRRSRRSACAPTASIWCSAASTISPRTGATS